MKYALHKHHLISLLHQLRQAESDVVVIKIDEGRLECEFVDNNLYKVISG